MQVTHGGLARPWRQADSSEHALGGIHRDAAHSGYKDIASRLSPEDLEEVHRLALAWKKNRHNCIPRE